MHFVGVTPIAGLSAGSRFLNEISVLGYQRYLYSKIVGNDVGDTGNMSP